MDNFEDFQPKSEPKAEAEFTDFGTSYDRRIRNSEPNENTFTIKDFLSLPHFDSADNCYQLIAALKSNDSITIEKVNDEDIHIFDVDASGVTVKYGDLQIEFDKFDLIKELESQGGMHESKKETKKDSDDDFSSNAIKKFKELFNINRVEQLAHLKSSDEYKNEHSKGDIYKIT